MALSIKLATVERQVHQLEIDMAFIKGFIQGTKRAGVSVAAANRAANAGSEGESEAQGA